MLDSADTGTGKRLRLAIVSTYDELCGIAGYTRALETQLREHMDIEVFDLDQYLLRSNHKRVKRLGDKHIEDIARRLCEFDSVNIQLEHGTLGKNPNQITRRLNMLLRASPCVSVTFHTILSDGPLPWETMWRMTKKGDVSGLMSAIGENIRSGILSQSIYKTLRKLGKTKAVRTIVHTKRDMRLLRDVHGLPEVYHHPLSYVSSEKAKAIRESTSRKNFPILASLPADAKFIGTFGFLSPYKGFESALQALRYLPDDYHLLIFGGIHPQSIQRQQPIDGYIAKLLKLARIGETLLNDFKSSGATMQISSDVASGDLLRRHPQDLHERIHFMGVLKDADFLAAMAVCDCVVLPYLEVGQSSSGPIAMALEMGCRVLASRTAAFLQFDRYHPGQVEYFDIGNYAELAERIRAEGSLNRASRTLAYNTKTNAELYVKANTPPNKTNSSKSFFKQKALS